MRIAYIRVSSTDQNVARQQESLVADRVFTDYASGKDVERPQLQAALAYVRDGDTLVVHSMDRLARNTEDMLRLVRELTARQVCVEFVKEKLVFGQKDDPMSTLMMTMLGGFAQFERALIRERQREGIAIAKSKGVYKGRKPSLTKEQVIILKQRVENKEPKAAIARDMGISRETLYQYLAKD